MPFIQSCDHQKFYSLHIMLQHTHYNKVQDLVSHVFHIFQILLVFKKLELFDAEKLIWMSDSPNHILNKNKHIK